MVGASAITVISNLTGASVGPWAAVLLLVALTLSLGLLLWVIVDMVAGDWIRSRMRHRR